MHSLRFLLTFAFSVLISHPSFAAGEQGDGASASLKDALLNFLPVAAILLVMFVFFQRQTTKSPRAKRAQEYLERGTQHMQRMEELMERLIKAVEANKRD